MYSAKEISEKLINDGFEDMTVRKINYYAFEKKMFPITGSGKSVFSEEDYVKLKSIAFLRQNSIYSLDEIKNKISTHSFQELDEMVLSKTITEYTSRNTITTDCLNNVSIDATSPSIMAKSTSAVASNTFNTNHYSNSSFTCSGNITNEVTDILNSSTTTSLSTNYTGTSPDFLRSNSSGMPQVNMPNLPSFATQISSSDLKKEKIIETNGKTRIKIGKGIFIEYDKSADKKEVEKLIEISKIIFD